MKQKILYSFSFHISSVENSRLQQQQKKQIFLFDIIASHLYVHICNFNHRITCFWHPKPNNSSLADEDVDVARERKRVTDGNAKDDVLRIEGLTKV